MLLTENIVLPCGEVVGGVGGVHGHGHALLLHLLLQGVYACLVVLQANGEVSLTL